MTTALEARAWLGPGALTPSHHRPPVCLVHSAVFDTLRGREGVAGDPPRPSLRVAVDDVAGVGQLGRCRGSAPALVARTQRLRTPTRSSRLGVAGDRPRPSLRAARRRARRAPRSRRRCRGSAPALVARPPAAVARPVGYAALPGFGPGPRCAIDVWAQRRHRRLGVAGVRPRPSLRVRADAAAPAQSAPGVAGVRPRPSLREVRRHAPGGRVDAAALPGFGPGPRCARVPQTLDARWTTRRCRGSAPALVARLQRCWTRVSGPALPGFGPGPRCAHAGSWTSRLGVAGFRPALVARLGQCMRRPVRGRCRGSAPALVARSTARCTRTRRIAALPGFGPGPRCATRRMHEARRPGVAGVRPRPSLRESRHAAAATRRAGVAGVRPRPSLREQHGRTDRRLDAGVAGVRPRPSLRDRRPPDCGRLRDGVAGVRPRPSLRGSSPQLGRRSRAAALPGFGPGPRCAWLAADKTIGGVRKALPGFGPGPRCADQARRRHGSHLAGRCRGSAPALVARSTGSCSRCPASWALPGSAPALVARRSR